jgi:hypothetical protein
LQFCSCGQLLSAAAGAKDIGPNGLDQTDGAARQVDDAGSCTVTNAIGLALITALPRLAYADHAPMQGAIVFRTTAFLLWLYGGQEG